MPILSTFLGIGEALGSGSDTDIASAIRDGAQACPELRRRGTVNEAGQHIVSRHAEKAVTDYRFDTHANVTEGGKCRMVGIALGMAKGG